MTETEVMTARDGASFRTRSRTKGRAHDTERRERPRLAEIKSRWLGLRERNLFRNVVLTSRSQNGSFNQGNRKRSLVAQQLEKIGDTIIRYSDLAAKRRAENS